MATITTDYKECLRQLAELMLAVSGESVTMMKRTAPEQAIKLKRQQEWGIYLEFLKVIFNLADRLVALHIPLKDQMEFMNGLEDAVTQQLKRALEPAFGNNADQMEIVMTIGTTVAESRQAYEHYKFLITEDSKTKNEMFRDFGDKVAEALAQPATRSSAPRRRSAPARSCRRSAPSCKGRLLPLKKRRRLCLQTSGHRRNRTSRPARRSSLSA